MNTMRMRDLIRRLAVLVLLFCGNTSMSAEDRPNVIVIMSDDQGVGDYGFMGNQVIRTPALDAMHARSGFLSKFYVSPVCAPTRASLMTGRYNYRTRCVDTFLGRAMMDPDEVTLAECLRDAGYRTGIYGKWHMGDNYPMRAMDQGFQESLVHRGGGIGQPSDPVGAEGKYTDPVLFKNGQEVSMKGYCTDIFFDAAMDFVSSSVEAGEPFFTYIATNAPHGPFDDVPRKLYEQYKNTDLSSLLVSPLPEKRREAEFDKLARIAAMITNIDENVARLFSKLDELDATNNTIVIYLNDNGPNSMRYVGDMRGMKTNVDDGGIRSPLLFHWPAKVKPLAISNELCAHIDVFPTILDACNVPLPESCKIDGRSFLPLLTDKEAEWPTRQVVFQAHRGNVPQLLNHFAIHEDPWKLVHPSGFGNERIKGEAKLELYNLQKDPRQMHDLAAVHPEIANRLTKAYQAWFADVSSTREDNFAPPRILIGTEHETETVLTRQDWRHGSGRAWAKDSNGDWLLNVSATDEYEVEIILDSDQYPTGTATVTAGNLTSRLEVIAGQQRGHRTTFLLPKGDVKLSAEVVFGEKTMGPHQVFIRRQ